MIVPDPDVSRHPQRNGRLSPVCESHVQYPLSNEARIVAGIHKSRFEQLIIRLVADTTEVHELCPSGLLSDAND